jgi:hypothetical protein
MRRLSRSLALAATFVVSLASAEEGRDPARQKARELGYAGVQAYQAADYATANAQLARAYEALPVPSLGLWSARALVKLGQLVQAAERYRQVTQLPVTGGNTAVQRQAQLDAAKELKEVMARIPRVRFRVRDEPGADVALSVDGVSLPDARLNESLSFNPGPHRVAARSGGQRVELGFEAIESAEREVLLDFAFAAPKPSGTPRASLPLPPSSDSRRVETWAWVSMGVGSAGLALGTVSGLLAVGKKGSLEDSGNCWDNHCSSAESDQVSSYNSLRRLSTISFVAGGAVAATGLVLLVTTKKSKSEVDAPRAVARSLELRVQPAGALLRGRF